MGYRPQGCDVAEHIDREVFDGLRNMTPVERLLIAVRASKALHRLSIAGLRLRHPTASEEELAMRAGALRLGAELTRRTFGENADWAE